MVNLSNLLEASAARHPDRIALVLDELQLSYAHVDHAASQVANLLVSRGIQPGDKVALSCPNVPSFTVIYFGILKVGATVVPLNVLLKPREIAYHLADSDAVAYFAFEGTEELPIGEFARRGFEEVPACRDLFLIDPDPRESMPWLRTHSTSFDTHDAGDDDTAVVLYTSGTTGQPKGAELRHRNMRDNALASAQLLAVDPDDPDTTLCVLPLFHAFGQTCIQNGGLATGATIVMLPRFVASTALDLMLQHRVTLFAGVPTMYWGMLSALDDTVDVTTLASNLRVASSGGAALPGEIHRQFKRRFGVTILEGYGLSETSPVASFSVYGQEPRVGSIGKPIPGVQFKLIKDDWTDVEDGADAVGEIAIKGHNVMKGYYNRPEATADAIRDGWFRSGDLAKRDDDGFYYIVDRSKDIIIRGGYNVYPREIEEVLMEHSAVSLVAVIAVPDPQHGEEVKAIVVKNVGYDDLSEDELVAWSRNRLAGYKYPRLVEFVNDLPMTSTGKILKRALA